MSNGYYQLIQLITEVDEHLVVVTLTLGYISFEELKTSIQKLNFNRKINTNCYRW